MLRRAILEQIRIFLHRLMANTPQLVAAGVESTQVIADALGPYGRWRVTPTGPLGHLVFAFTKHYDDTGDEPARLTTAAFGGDPHVHTVSLGDTTALALAGTRPDRPRPVGHRLLPGRPAPPRPRPAPLVGQRRQPRHRHHRGRAGHRAGPGAVAYIS